MAVWGCTRAVKLFWRGGWVGLVVVGWLRPGVLLLGSSSVGVLSVHKGFCSLKILPIGNWLGGEATRDIDGGFLAQKSLLRFCP